MRYSLVPLTVRRERTLRQDGELLGREAGERDWESRGLQGTNFTAGGHAGGTGLGSRRLGLGEDRAVLLWRHPSRLQMLNV